MSSFFDCLSQGTSIFDYYLLEASAGTGKTFAIEHIFARLIIESYKTEEPLLLERILVLTFTKAAARELKTRIFGNLERIVQFLKSANVKSEAMFDYLTPFIQNEDLRKKAIFLLENSLLLFDRHQIFTIHSFCFRAMKEFAFEAKVKISFEEKQDFKSIIRKMAVNYLKYFINPEEYPLSQICHIRNKYKKLNILVEEIIKHFSKISQVEKKLSFNEVYEKFNDEVRNLPGDLDKEKLFLDYEKLYPQFSKSKIELNKLELDRQAEILFNIAAARYAARQDLMRLIKSKRSILEYFALDNQKKRSKILPLHYPAIMQEMEKMLLPWIKEARSEKNILSRLASEIFEYVGHHLNQQEIFTFDEILLKVNKALALPSFKKALQAKFQAFIVDEFQDTDNVQWEIFQKLFFHEKYLRAAFLIGDPKQSIYRFRRADLYTYFQASKMASSCLKLDTNFRSSERLINSLNYLFGMAKGWLKLPKMRQTIPYFSVKANKANFEFDDQKKSVHFFIAEDKLNASGTSKSIEGSFFSYIVNELIRLHKVFTWENMAILVKDRYQATKVKNYLERANIPYVTKKRDPDNFYFILSALKEFLLAVRNPNDLNRVKIALLGPFVGWDIEKIKVFENDNFHCLTKFYFLKETFLAKGGEIFFNEFFKCSFETKTIVQQLLDVFDLAFYHDFMEVIEFLLDRLKSHKTTLDDFIELIDDIYIDFDEDELSSGPQGDENGVNILTIHVSKGLEYEAVFALGLYLRGKNSEEDVDEDEAEQQRLLYVSLTRAKNRVYVPFAIEMGEKSKNIKNSPIEKFLACLTGKEGLTKEEVVDFLQKSFQETEISYEFLQPDKMGHVSLDKGKKEVIRLADKHALETKAANIYSFSRLKSQSGESMEIFKKGDKLIPASAETGIILHTILEKIFNQGNFHFDAISKIVRNEIKNTPLEGYLEEIKAMIEAVVHVPLLNGKCTPASLSLSDYKTEVEFLFSYKGEYIKGVIDLIFQYERRFYFLDWKSNYLGEEISNYNPENLGLYVQNENYDLQAAIYQEALWRQIKLCAGKETFGGAYYIFLRGIKVGQESGIYYFMPNAKIIDNSLIQKGQACLR